MGMYVQIGYNDKEGELLQIGRGVPKPLITVYKKIQSAPVKGGIKYGNLIYQYILTLPVFSRFLEVAKIKVG